MGSPDHFLSPLFFKLLLSGNVGISNLKNANFKTIYIVGRRRGWEGGSVIATKAFSI